MSQKQPQRSRAVVVEDCKVIEARAREVVVEEAMVVVEEQPVALVRRHRANDQAQGGIGVSWPCARGARRH